MTSIKDLEKSNFLMGFITPKHSAKAGATGQANEKRCKIKIADALEIGVDDLIK